MFNQGKARPSEGLLSMLLLTSTVNANGLNFPFPFNATEPVTFRASVDPSFVKETVLKASLYRPSIDLLDAEVSNAGATEGPSRANMTNLATTWANDYDWFKSENEIFGNFSHYAVTVPGGQGFDHPVPLHFVHERSDVEDAIPLLLLHGWPSSHLEWSKVIGPLTSPEDGADAQAFHIVAPDLPGYGFSPAPTYSGMGSRQIGAALDQLMKKLGYDNYGVVSTDLGWWTGLYLADMVPDSIIGHYSDFWLIEPNATDLERLAQNQTTDEETAYINSYQTWFNEHYVHGPVHALAPLAIGQAMTDTPVGFAGWVWHLMHPISDGYPYTYEELITQTMMLFIQGTFGNMRHYKPVFQEDNIDIPKTTVPTGVGQWGSPNGPLESYKNIHLVPRDWMERIVNVVYVSKHESGGHFPANNVPDLYVEDLREFFGSL
ncbi:hypothetical protein DL767_005930 [Monosporascus sp. MG133]|nr:hypothetical protein DL767_005930 [Monosporascus sp. MG133]